MGDDGDRKNNHKIGFGLVFENLVFYINGFAQHFNNQNKNLRLGFWF